MTSRSAHVPLGRELLLNFAVIGALAMALIFLVLTLMIQSSFGKLEQAEVDKQIGRAESFLNENREGLALGSKDWGFWDETFAYVTRFEPGFEERNVNLDSFRNARIDGLVAVRADGSDARAYFFDPDSDEPNPGLAQAARTIVQGPAYRREIAAYGAAKGYALLNGRLYALAGTRVLRSDRTGPSPGDLTFVKRVEAATIGKALQLPVTIETRDLEVRPKAEPIGDIIRVTVPVIGLEGKPVSVLRFRMERGVMAAGHLLRNLALVAVAILLLAMLILLNRRVAVLVLDPVRKLRNHVTAIRTSGQLAALEGPVAPNELGDLQIEFNDMTHELDDLRAEVERQSFALGRSQSAVGAMHNVRNSLSPVNVILGTLDHSLGQRLPPEAQRALSELADPAVAPERRLRLVQFLSTLLEEFDHAIDDARGRTREAGRHLASALEAISGVQRSNGTVDYAEACDLGGMLGRAVNAARYVEGARITVDLDIPERIVARGNRVLLNQVIENLVTNAIEAIVARGQGEGQLTVRAEALAERSVCRITVADDGDGFPPQLAAHLFERGFSTRGHKSGGMGLHWCANTINAMGGKLRLESAGSGLGATATIELPLVPAAADAASAA